MIAPETARAATEVLWQAMVELAEAGNDRVVQTQASGDASDAAAIATIAADLATLTHAAAILARSEAPPP